MNLRTYARGRPCLVRLPGCDGGGETTVLAHFRDLSLGSGVGLKPSDLAAGAWCCDSCHSIIDQRMKAPLGLTRTDIRLAHAIGVLRTIAQLERDGLLSVQRAGRVAA